MIRTDRSRRTGLLALATAVLAAAPAALRAQQPDAPPPPPAGQPPMGGMRGPGGRGGMMLFEGITLSDAQKAKIDSIQSAGRARMQGMMQPGSPPDSAARATMRQEREAQQTAMRNVLTADQQKTYDANVAKMRERMQQRGPGGPPPRQ